MRYVTMFLLLAMTVPPAALPQKPSAPAAQGGPTAAQAVAAAMMPACDGSYVMVRLSEIKPGAWAKFMEAAAAQQAWYRSNGVANNRILVARVIDHDDATGEFKNSETQALTYHINPPGLDQTLPRGDEGYKAFVAMYRESSQIKSEWLTCSPKM